jgi:hypothetical protein
MKVLILLGLGLFLSNLQAQTYHTDIRGTDDATDGGMFQLATPSANHYLRLFSGRVGDPKPYLYFSEPDTFRIASGISNFSNFRENLTILNGLGTGPAPTTFIGINNPQPTSELDITTSDADDGAEIRISNSDNSHFLRFFSGRQNLAYPSIYWKQGDSLSLGTNQNTYTEILRLLDDGTMRLNSNKGIVMNAGDRPLITRGWDPFVSGSNTGIGRWGIFMEPFYLTFGTPNIGDRGFQFVTYNDDGTIAQNQMRLKNGKLGLNNTDPQHLLDVNGDLNITGTLMLSSDPGTSGQVLTSNGSGDPTWTNSANPQVGFKAFLIATISVPTFVDTTLESFVENFDDGNNFDPTTGVFIAPSTGLYHFEFISSWDTPGPTYSDIPIYQRIKLNGGTNEQITAKVSLTTSSTESVVATYNLKLNPGDKIAFSVVQNAGANLNLFANGGTGDTKISGFQVY